MGGTQIIIIIMASVGNLEDAARKRKERLAALKKRAQDSKGTGGNEDEPPTKIAAKEPKFRSYQPEDDQLKDKAVEAAKPVQVEPIVQEQLEASKPVPLVEEVDLVNLAPRKPDWDLKRDVAKKLEKLEKRTQRAIAELIRERLQSGEREDLAAVVNAKAVAAAQRQNDDHDDYDSD
ncbi:coiled-coil domain-containing protein 12-like [Branchiostoma floridae x Branchiostoma belcheri]